MVPFDGVDAVVHPAAEMLLAPLVDMDLEVLDAVLRTNILGKFVVQQAARRLRVGGSVVNLSSSVIDRALPTYPATKGAVQAMTVIVAHELRGRDVNVTSVAPGPIATDMFLQDKDEEAVAFFAHAAPLERLGTRSDIAEAVALVTSPAGRWVNRQTCLSTAGCTAPRPSTSGGVRGAGGWRTQRMRCARARYPRYLAREGHP